MVKLQSNIFFLQSFFFMHVKVAVSRSNYLSSLLLWLVVPTFLFQHAFIHMLYGVIHFTCFNGICLSCQCMPNIWWKQSRDADRVESDMWLCFYVTSFCFCISICKLFLLFKVQNDLMFSYMAGLYIFVYGVCEIGGAIITSITGII